MLIQHSLRSGLEPTTLDEVNKMAVDEWLGFVLNVCLSLDVVVQVAMAMLRKLGVTLCRQEISKLSSSWFAKGQDGSRGGRDLAWDVKQGVNVRIWGCILLEQWVLIGNRSWWTHPRWASMQNGFTQCIETFALGSSEFTASGSGANQRLISARVSIFVRWHAQSPRQETIARKQDMNRSMQVRST